MLSRYYVLDEEREEMQRDAATQAMSSISGRVSFYEH